jgi:2-amino-4-hydroxy-6-hydroxymethyldihydropteridine diphosphokinase
LVQVCVAFGANLGDAKGAVLQAMADVGGLARTQLLKASALYASAPVEAIGPQFINAVALYSTDLPPLELLDDLQRLENTAGRERPYLHAPRTLDLDMIWYGDLKFHSPRLTLPHPRWQQRAFVLVPLAEICPELVKNEWLEQVSAQEIARL